MSFGVRLHYPIILLPHHPITPLVSEDKRSEEKSFLLSVNLYSLHVSVVKKCDRSAEVSEVSQR